jgi:ATP-dependent Clp protease ATP-binding subunit ClpC
MVERYTEHARRCLFIARDEAFDLGSAFIETEHLLLALVREHQVLAGVLDGDHLSYAAMRREIEARTSRRARAESLADVPFSEEAKRALSFAAQESDRLLHTHIGVEHLLLGLFRETRGLAAAMLKERGLQLAHVRDRIVQTMGASSPLPFAISFGHRGHHERRRVRVSPSRREPHEEPVVVSSLHHVAADGFTLKALIAWAYRTDERDIELPAGTDERARYDLTLELPSRRSWPAIDQIIQDGLQGHFSIVVNRETKSVEAFVLTAGDGPSPGRRKVGEGDAAGSQTMYTAFSTLALAETPERLSLDGPEWRNRLHSIGPIILTATTIHDFAHWLEAVVDGPVIDETGLDGLFDIEVRGEMQGFDELRRALAEELALVLTRTRRDAPVLVVTRRM